MTEEISSPKASDKQIAICRHCFKGYGEHGAGQYEDFCLTWSERDLLHKPDGSGNRWSPIILRSATEEELREQRESLARNYKPGERQAVSFRPAHRYPCTCTL